MSLKENIKLNSQIIEKKSLNKINGLNFLQCNFDSICVNCHFIRSNLDSINDLSDDNLYNNDSGILWRVRSGRKIGSELDSPQATLNSLDEVNNFIKQHSSSEPTLEYVIHRVNNHFFNPIYVGTLALRDRNIPSMLIELQTINKEKIKNMDNGGARPRDWESVLNIEFDYQKPPFKINYINDVLKTSSLSKEIYTLWKIGRDLHDSLEKNGYDTEAVARFNIYSSEDILFDDLRSVKTFKY